ncbi:hypothetical protein PspLS_02161 [Pyricularia sp. CBS 133598]|nr:hypothetical protein PspLS_02161 [Pyricularia sp. CBS 133598]
MPPRVQCPSIGSAIRQQSRQRISPRHRPTLQTVTPVLVDSSVLARRTYATAAPLSRLGGLQLPADYVPPTQPPSARRPETRKSQLLRAYTSLLRSTPLTLIFQHSNLTSQEWAAVRRELRAALAKVPIPATPEGVPPPVDIVKNIQLQVIRTRIFDQAFKVVEFFDPEVAAAKTPGMKKYNHDLSKAAYEATSKIDLEAVPDSSMYKQIAPLLVGPIALVTFPTVSPDHVAAVLRTLAPSAPAFPAPTRRASPSYHEPIARSGMQKLLLVGGRVEDRVFDLDGVKWLGGIQGGRDALRAQVVHMLQSAGLGLTMALEGASKSLWLTMESRRTQLEDEAKGPEEAAEKKDDEAQS